MSVVTLSTFTACKKIDLFPANSIEQSQSFQTLKDAQTWDAGISASFRGRQYGSYTFATDIQADQLNASLDFGNRNGSTHRWGENFLAQDGVISGQWGAYYSALSNINNAIVGYEKIVTSTPAEASTLSRYKGNLYFARAFYYHRLVLRWAKAYNPATASTDLAIPLLLTFDVNAQPARATVKEIYDQILLDISQAKTLLSAVSGVQGSTAFTIDAVVALEARVKLYTQDWAGAYTAANSLITPNKYPLITTAAGLKSYWHTDGNQESIMQCFVSKPNELANTNSVYLGLIPATGRFTPDFIPAKWVVDSYIDNDFRKGIYFGTKNITVSGINYANVSLVDKYPGNPALFTGAATNYQHAPKVFRIAEMYLIAAEAAARNNNPTGAATALNALRTSRGLIGLSGLLGTPLIDAIKEERFRELAFEGFRLDDLKRYGEGFTRRDPQSLEYITTGVTYNLLSVTATDDKFVWGIPTSDMTVNSNLIQNKGW